MNDTSVSNGSNGTPKPVAMRRQPAASNTASTSDAVQVPTYEERETKDFELGATFNIDLGYVKDPHTKDVQKDAAGKPIKRTRMIQGFAKRTEWVPEIDPSYEFPTEDTKIAIMGLVNGDNVLIHGHTGTGKTTLIEQIAARLNWQVVRINFDAEVSRADLIGTYVVRGSSMEFMWGILPRAFRMPGTIILMDEWDAMSSDCAFVVQRALEKNNRKLLVLETGGTLIPLHNSNRIFATANTRGLGDDTGLYAGTKGQNYAQLNRFGLTIHLQYLEEAKEIKMLQSRFPAITTTEVEMMVKCANTIRKAYENSTISVPLSPRDVINWMEKYGEIAKFTKSAQYCFLNRMPPEDEATVKGIITRAFPKEADLK